MLTLISPRVTALARKRPRSFCQKCTWQLTAKHAYTLRMWLCMKCMVHGCMVYTERAVMETVSCGTSHASAVSTPLRWIFKKALWKVVHSCRITCERSESAREQRIALYESDQQSTTHTHRATLVSHRPLSNRHFNYWSINTSMPVFFIKSMTILAVGALSALHCLCCWVCVASFERWLTPLCVDYARALINSLVCWLCTSAD